MRPDSLDLLELLAPALFIVGVIYLLVPTLPIARGWVRCAIFAIVSVSVCRYLYWRLFITLLPAHGTWYEIGWLWLCFSVELLVFADQFIVYILFLRTSDRRAEADRHEARLRALPPDQLPSVDIYIPTYNEPINVLETSIVGALCLDYPNAKVWVLDDGRRPWLKAFCEAKGVGYINRPNNDHAKAGNINHALTRTSADFVAVFDADFVPRRNFLMRAIGFFESPNVGIVQIPHAFYNADQMQANLGLQNVVPDEQRFFFDVLMPSRDAWDVAFCCGSNSVTRRNALRAIGDALPTESITEDLILSMSLLRKGYITRYLSEHLAFGLAPETVEAFFVQRQRWARGAIQILFLKGGPFGRGLTWLQRLLFLPTYWLSVGPRALFIAITPIVFLWLGVSPVFDVTVADIVYYVVPTALALAGGMSAFTSSRHSALVSQIQSTFLGFRIMPTILETFVKPFGHPFKVTPKGTTTVTSNYARGIYFTATTLIWLTVVGLAINSVPEWRIVRDSEALPVVAFWSIINVIVLFLVAMMALEAPRLRKEERFELDEPISLVRPDEMPTTGRIRDLSLNGVGLTCDRAHAVVRVGESVRVFITEVGFISGTVARHAEPFVAVEFHLPPSLERDLLIRKLFTVALPQIGIGVTSWWEIWETVRSIWKMRSAMLEGIAATTTKPAGLSSEKLPAQSLAIPPRRNDASLAEIANKRQMAA